MSLFYLVLLSLAEHAGFSAAFAVASAITMNGAYMGALMSVTRNLPQAGAEHVQKAKI